MSKRNQGYGRYITQRNHDSGGSKKNNCQGDNPLGVVNVGTDLNSFLNRLRHNVSLPNKFDSNVAIISNEADVERWFQCWSAASCGYLEVDSVQVLLQYLMILPSTNKLLPSHNEALNVLLFVVKNNTSFCRPHTELDLKTGLLQLNLVLALTHRLLDSIPSVKETYSLISPAAELLDSYDERIKALQGSFPRETHNIHKLRMKANILQRYKDKVDQLVRGNEVKEESDMKSWLGWRDKPTVDWLMSGSWHYILPLKSKYASHEEYAVTLLRMWTMLTFYWGSGAVWQRCAYRQEGGNKDNEVNICGEPMLVQASANQRCNSSGCESNRSATWRCRKPGHDATCEHCLRIAQSFRCGSPGTKASTDIYDGLVIEESIRNEGVVLLVSELRSRNQPRIPPNWKTSYRLPISGLIGVVRLGSARSALSRDMQIIWAEIVPYDVSNKANDWNRRAKGFIACRIITKTDFPSMPEMDTAIPKGTRLAIIDLRVFVPEVLSVLFAFADDSFVRHLTFVPFVQRLIGNNMSPRPSIAKSQKSALRTLSTLFSVSNPNLRDVVTQSINNSEIELLQEYPLNTTEVRNHIIDRICSIKHIQMLYGTQLTAFASGLCFSTHCIQGPPGTGKVREI